MRKLVYATSLSLDGYIDAEAGDPSWVVPDEELHRHFNEIEREIDTLPYGCRMYELMTGYWPTADHDPFAPAVIVEYAQLWKPISKVVFSSTLESVDWNSLLARGDAVAEVAKLKAQPAGPWASVASSWLQAWHLPAQSTSTSSTMPRSSWVRARQRLSSRPFGGRSKWVCATSANS